MNLGSVLILILISITIGFLIGALVYGLRARPENAPPAQADQANSPEDGVRIWRDPQTQNLVVELDGKTHQQAGELGPEGRSRLARLARDWQIWLGMPSSRLATLVASSGEVSAAGAPGGEVTAGFQLEFGGAANAAAAGDVTGVTKDPSPAAAPQSVAGARSIAAQIDEILQARLQNTPLAQRGIQLVELPDQGLVVRVGQAQYTDLTQVPDEQVRAAIAAAVADWEQKQ